MNNTRRKALLESIKNIELAYNTIEEAGTDERDCAENLPENLQDSDRYYEMEERATELEDIATELYDIIDRINECL
jgi:hypothetical protein